MPPKRKRAVDSDVSATPAKQLKQDGQRALAKDLHIPLDTGIANHLKDINCKIFIDEDTVIYDASLNQSNVGNNNNKFYILQLVQEGVAKKTKHYTYTRWGRVGEFGQDKLIGPSDLSVATKDFEKKFKDKSGLAWSDRDHDAKKSKYTFIQKNYEDDEDDDNDTTDAKHESDVKQEHEDDQVEAVVASSKLPLPTQRLVELIFNENHFNSVLENIGYSREKLPLGKLSKSTILKGFKHLQELASLIKHPSLAQSKYEVSREEAVEDLTNRYYSTIPHVFGRNRPPMINNNDVLQREVAMLDTLSDMEIANQIMKTTHDKARDVESVSLIDQRFEQLGCDIIEPLEHGCDEYKGLEKYLISTAGKTHEHIRYRLQDIFRVKRAGEDDRFTQGEHNKRPDSCRRLLWHGSRTTNFGGILSQGLRIAPPEAPANGYMFGKGIYLADVSTKSANYCRTSTSGGTGLLLLCEVELGNPMYELLNADSSAGEKCLKQGSIATLGIGQTVPQEWTDAGAIHSSLKGILMPDIDKAPADQTNHPNAYLQYNEYIIYSLTQCRIRYLLRFST